MVIKATFIGFMGRLPSWICPWVHGHWINMVIFWLSISLSSLFINHSFFMGTCFLKYSLPVSHFFPRQMEILLHNTFLYSIAAMLAIYFQYISAVVLNTLAPRWFRRFSQKNSSFRLPYQRPISSANCARELFNGSNGSASLVKIFCLAGAVFLWVTS